MSLYELVAWLYQSIFGAKASSNLEEEYKRDNSNPNVVEGYKRSRSNSTNENIDDLDETILEDSLNSISHQEFEGRRSYSVNRILDDLDEMQIRLERFSEEIREPKPEKSELPEAKLKQYVHRKKINGPKRREKIRNALYQTEWERTRDFTQNRLRSVLYYRR